MSIIDAVDRAISLAVLSGWGLYVIREGDVYAVSRWCDHAPLSVVAVVTPEGTHWVS